MRGVLWIVLLFVVAVVAATTLGPNDGIVSIHWGAWRVDLSLNLFVIGLLVACGVVVAAARALQSLVSLPRRAAEWRALRRERAAQAALRESLVEYFGARYSRAHKAARRAQQLQTEAGELASDADFGVHARLLAAGSLHKLQDRNQRDETLASLLNDARPGSPAADGARLLAAEWALEDRDAERALEMLAELPPGVGRRTQALRLKLQALRMVRQPLDALHTARLLANHQAFSPAAAQGLLRSLAVESLDGTHDLEQLRRVWERFDAADRSDAHVAARAAHRAVLLEGPALARDWLRPFWDRLPDLAREEREEIALALADAVEGVGTDWLSRLEAAQTAFSHEPAVAAAVGLAFAERQLWGKSRRLLEQAAAAPTLPARLRRTAWRALAAQAREEADDSRAIECERAAALVD